MTHALKDAIQVRACVRAYVAKRVHRLPDPKSSWLQEGIDFHAACESFLKHGHFGRPPEDHIARLAAAAVAFAPPGPPGSVPSEVTLPFEFAGRTLSAHVDAIGPNWDQSWDWKKSSSREYEHDDASLARDVQTHWQGLALMLTTGRTSWRTTNVYVDRKSYRPRPATCVISLAECEAYWQAEILPALRLCEALDVVRPAVLAAPHDPTSCARRDGKNYCSFYGHCRMLPSTGPSLVQLRAAAGFAPRSG